MPVRLKIIERKEWGPWTTTEYALVWSVSRATVYKWMGRGWLGSSKIGDCRRIMPSHDKAFRERFESGEAA